MNSLFFVIFLINFITCSLINEKDKIIISLTSDHKNIQNIKLIINSIIVQNVYHEFYEILLILSKNEFKDVKELPKELIMLEKNKTIKILFVPENLTNISRTLITMKIYKRNAILIINNNCILPDGWLKMFIDDHFKYPNDAIVASFQFFFGKDCEIKELKEGFKGEIFGTFNHITEMILNFALININLGGILYPKNFFKNKLFYDKDLFIKTNISEDFWQSAFIIIEDNTLRQSSKIFDYSKYLINNINYKENSFNKIILLEKEKLEFIKLFPNFDYFIEKRQKKIIVSITSYPKRFVFLPKLMRFIRKQSFHINNIIFFIYEEDIKSYDLHIDDINIILVTENLRPHLKYYYAMTLFRDYAIITIDDDIGYAKDTFESLFNAYIDNPNIISGRRSHLMTFKNNGELKGYFKWIFEQTFINESSFNLTLTNNGGSIFPPDILNINEDFKPIIHETITCDDLTLKYYANLKGIPHKWIFNKNLMGTDKIIKDPKMPTLYKINHINNDICINKLNMMINKFFLKNLCVPYRNVPTGNSIYLFDIHNLNTLQDIIYFELYAYSFCPIDINIYFTIYFDNYTSICSINENMVQTTDIYENQQNTNIANCYIKNFVHKIYNLDDCLFPRVETKENIIMKIYNYRKYLTLIFKDFICKNSNNCTLYAISYENINLNFIPIIINNIQYICKVNKIENISYSKFPNLEKLECNNINILDYKSKVYVSGIPKKVEIKKNFIDNYEIPNQFIISEIIFEKVNMTRQIIIKGKLVDNPKTDLFYFHLNVINQNITLNCVLKANSKFVQSKINCIIDIVKNNDIFIENQIIHSIYDENIEILLINEETLIKTKINKEKNNFEEYFKFSINNNYKKYNLLKIYILIALIIISKRIFFFKLKNQF